MNTPPTQIRKKKKKKKKKERGEGEIRIGVTKTTFFFFFFLFPNHPKKPPENSTKLNKDNILLRNQRIRG